PYPTLFRSRAGALAGVRAGRAGGGRARAGRRDLAAGAARVTAWLVRRLLWGLVTLLGVLGFLFVLFFATAEPEDIAKRALGEKAPPEAIARWIANHGYDRPRVWNPEDPLDTMLV